MTKKNFIALADVIKLYNDCHEPKFDVEQIHTLAHFCAVQNPSFNRERWLGYIAGSNGKNGGKR